MNNDQFQNMIQVLSYFASQCNMFKPMLDGVTSLQQENVYLKEELDKSIIIQNRMQLNTAFSADYANFGVAVSKNENEETGTIKAEKEKNDLYNLIKSVITVGRDNYVRKDMEYKLDFYSMIEKISFEQYMELLDLLIMQDSEDIIPIAPIESDNK